ncbi:Uncharacterized protein Fot_06227 [Forsythia ovata]|uniref:Uncharacterized protein n=1 Tax=Forsythia ovata TaxID=205694 RepID=A0ABD1WVA3_9LAMI
MGCNATRKRCYEKLQQCLNLISAWNHLNIFHGSLSSYVALEVQELQSVQVGMNFNQLLEGSNNMNSALIQIPNDVYYYITRLFQRGDPISRPSVAASATKAQYYMQQKEVMQDLNPGHSILWKN